MLNFLNIFAEIFNFKCFAKSFTVFYRVSLLQTIGLETFLSVTFNFVFRCLSHLIAEMTTFFVFLNTSYVTFLFFVQATLNTFTWSRFLQIFLEKRAKFCSIISYFLTNHKLIFEFDLVRKIFLCFKKA